MECLVEFFRFEALVQLDLFDRVVYQDVDMGDLLQHLRDQDVVRDGDRELHGVCSDVWRLEMRKKQNKRDCIVFNGYPFLIRHRVNEFTWMVTCVCRGVVFNTLTDNVCDTTFFVDVI